MTINQLADKYNIGVISIAGDLNVELIKTPGRYKIYRPIRKASY